MVSNSQQSLLRWAGSKRRLLPQLSHYWMPHYQRYIEPFVGSGALFFSLNPTAAVLGDINADLIDCLKTVRDQPKEVHETAVSIPSNRDSYYQVRAIVPSSLTDVQRAARFIFLNRFSFNGLYRTNLAGQFNVPYAPTKTGRLPSLESFNHSAEKLKNAVLTCSDFEFLLSEHARPGDFVYLDPPYAASQRRIFSEYDKNTFTLSDLDRLASSLSRLDKLKAHWVLSYAYCRESLEAFDRWPSRKIFIQRNIAGFSRHRRKAAELIVSNVPEKLQNSAFRDTR